MSTFKTLMTEALEYFTLPTKLSGLINDKNFVCVEEKTGVNIGKLTSDEMCKDNWSRWGQYQETLTVTNSTITVPINSISEYGGGARYFTYQDVRVDITLLTSNTVKIGTSENNLATMTQNTTYSFNGIIYIEVMSGSSASFSYEVYGEEEVNVPITTYDVLDLVYPVGSIYMSLNPVSPSILFGGVWREINDTFLLASGVHNIGAKGGSEYVSLTTNELPSHTHIQDSHTHTQGSHTHKPSNTALKFMDTDTDIKINETKRVMPSTGSSQYVVYTTSFGNGISEVSSTNSAQPSINGQTAVTNATGGGDTHYNMPPFKVVHMWKRISEEMLNVYDTSKWNNSPTVSQANSSVTCNAVKFVSLNEEFTTDNHYTLTYDVVLYGNREGLYFFSDPTVTSENGWHFVRDIYNSFWQNVENGTIISEEDLGKNYHTSGTHKVIIIRDGDIATLIFDGVKVIDGFDVSGLKNTVGMNKWQNGSIQMKNFDLKLDKC